MDCCIILIGPFILFLVVLEIEVGTLAEAGVEVETVVGTEADIEAVFEVD